MRELMNDVEELVENEWYIVRNSGEIPEIAYNSSIYYLTRAASGPSLQLSVKQLKMLKDAATERYLEIVLRDLDHSNAGTSIYRGVARSICNYERFCSFCARQQIRPEIVQVPAAKALALFLRVELSLFEKLGSSSALNCSFRQLQQYANVLGVEFGSTYDLLGHVCPDEE
jgi:hypothetical protein